MKEFRGGFVLSALLLVLLVACAPNIPVTVIPLTLAPQMPTGPANPGPVSGLAANPNNPGGLVAQGPPEPTAPPPTAVPPVAKAPNGVPPGAANPGNSGPGALLPPACDVTKPSVTQVESFCVKGLGGASFYGLVNESFQAQVQDPKVTCQTISQPAGVQDVCTGPAGTSFKVEMCNVCQAPAGGNAWACAPGYTLVNGNDCKPNDPNHTYILCPPGTHFDNNLQNCADDVTGNLANPCPSDHPYFIPPGTCGKFNPQIVLDCETFTIPLGFCGSTIKKQSAAGTGGGATPCIINPLTGACE
jgi:hypothetical protein